jgi:hypothetical protein
VKPEAITRESDMDNRRIEDLARRVEELSERLAGIEGRIARLEAASRRMPAGDDSDRPPRLESTPADRPADGGEVPGSAVGLWMERYNFVVAAGLTFVALSIALLLRQLTLSGLFPLVPGIASAAGYCLLLIALSEWFRSKKRGLEALLLNLLGTMILYALLLESFLRHGVLGGTSVRVGILLVLTAGLIQSHRHDSRLLAGAHTVAVLACGFILLRESVNLLFTSGLVWLLCLGLMILSTRNRWKALVGPALFVSDLYLFIMILVARARMAAAPDGPKSAMVTLIAFFLLNSAFFLYKNLILKERMGALEFAQIPMVILITFGGAYSVLPLIGLPLSILGWVGIALAVACYAVAVDHLRPKEKLKVAFHFYNLVGFLYALFSVCLLLGKGAALPAVLALLSVPFCLVGKKLREDAFVFESYAFALAALVAMLVSRRLFLFPAAAGGLPATRPTPGGLALFGIAGVAVIFNYFVLRLDSGTGRTPGSPAWSGRSILTLGLFATGTADLLGVARLAGFLLLGEIPGRVSASAEPAASFVMMSSLVLVLGAFAVFAAALRLDLKDLLVFSAGLFLVAGGKILVHDFLTAPVGRVIPQVFLFGVVLLVSSYLYGRRKKKAAG